MKMYRLECPACGACVEIEPERESCFCSHCGRKIFLEDNTKRVEITKNINYHKTITDEARIRDVEFRERVYDKETAKEKEREKQKRKLNLITALGVILLVSAFLAVSAGFFYSEEKKSDQEEAKLQEILEEVMQEIDEGDYNTARIKAETLYYTSNWSSEIEEKWDATRKEIIKQIDAAEKSEQKTKTVDKSQNIGGGKWWNPFD